MTWPQRPWFNISLFLTLKVLLFLCIFTFQFQNEPQDKEASKTKWKEASSRRGKIHLHLLNLSLMTLPLVQKQRRAMLEMLRRKTSDFQKVLCMKSTIRFLRLCRSRPRQERESRLRNGSLQVLTDHEDYQSKGQRLSWCSGQSQNNCQEVLSLSKCQGRAVRAGPAPGGVLCSDSLVDGRGHDGEASSVSTTRTLRVSSNP